MTESYAQLTYETSKKRITLAGYRIANVVIQIYEDGKLDEESVLVKWERMKKFSEELNMKDKK